MANRRQNTEHSYTFHGRDVYAYTGAKLASGHISFEEVGPELSVDHIVELPVVETIIEDHLVKGAIDILDVRFGSLWTSITREEFYKLEPEFGDRFEVTIYHADMLAIKIRLFMANHCRCENWATHPLHQLSLSFRFGYQPRFLCQGL